MLKGNDAHNSGRCIGEVAPLSSRQASWADRPRSASFLSFHHPLSPVPASALCSLLLSLVASFSVLSVLLDRDREFSLNNNLQDTYSNQHHTKEIYMDRSVDASLQLRCMTCTCACASYGCRTHAYAWTIAAGISNSSQGDRASGAGSISALGRDRLSARVRIRRRLASFGVRLFASNIYD